MAKKSKKRIQIKKPRIIKASEDLNKLQNNLKEALASDNTKKAVSVCHQMFRLSDFKFEANAVDITNAFSKRIFDQLNHQPDKADELYKNIIRVQPAIEHTFSLSLKTYIKFCSTADSGSLTDEYIQNDEVKKVLDEYILKKLKDIRIPAENSSLKDDFILKKEAVILLNAWEEIENDKENFQAYNKMLKKIGRNSPYKYWRIFIQALRYFYSSEDETALKCLKRINSESPLFNAAENLTCIINGESADNGIILKNKLFRDRINNELLIIEKELENENFSNETLKRICSLCKSKYFYDKEILLKNIIAAIIENLVDLDEDENFEFIDSYKHFFHSCAIHEYSWGEDDVETWEYALDDIRCSYPDIEKALIYKHIAELIWKSLKNGNLSILDMLHNFRQQKTTKTYIKKVYNKSIIKHWEKSVSLYPIKETFQNWYEMSTNIEPGTKSEKILLQWHEAFPEDEEALFKLVFSLKKRKVFTKAEYYCSILRKLVPGHPKLKIYDDFLLIDSALKQYKNSKYKKCAEMLAKPLKSTEISAHVLRNLLKNEALLKLAVIDNVNEITQELVSFKQPVLILYLIEKLKYEHALKITNSLDICTLLREQLMDADTCLKSLNECFNINDAFWGQFKLYSYSIENGNYENLSLSSEFICSVLKNLFDNIELRYLTTVQECIWGLTTEGLKRNDSSVYKFLFFRAVIIKYTFKSYLYGVFTRNTEKYKKRLTNLLAAALKIADNNNDHLIFEYFKPYFIEYEELEDAIAESETITSKEISQIIAKEAKEKIHKISNLDNKKTYNQEYKHPDLFENPN